MQATIVLLSPSFKSTRAPVVVKENTGQPWQRGYEFRGIHELGAWHWEGGHGASRGLKPVGGSAPPV